MVRKEGVGKAFSKDAALKTEGMVWGRKRRVGIQMVFWLGVCQFT
jgi:hypothetical protein